MGQFQSTAYNGDPYIDLMRDIPERELIFWVQKVIWLAEGMTFMEHFCRTYPGMFLTKCQHCNGAGTVTCPACKGYKVRKGPKERLRLAKLPGTAATLARGGDGDECKRCGDYCEWDEESEWHEKWTGWEKKLAYYDRTYGALMDEWYEDVLNEGNLEEDTPHEPDTPPDDSDLGTDAQLARDVAKIPELMGAMMTRYDGHPYENDDVLPLEAADPTKSLAELMEDMDEYELPPEMHPEAFPELLLAEGPGGIKEFDHQLRMEALIMSNLDAAVKDAPKPYMFQPTAGTIPCPGCQGTPWAYRLTPNLAKLTRTEHPFWLRTLSRMGRYWDDPTQLPAGAVPQTTDRRPYLEYPTRDEAEAEAEEQLAGQLTRTLQPLRGRGAVGAALARGARNSDLGLGESLTDSRYLREWGLHTGADNPEPLWLAQDHPVLGSSDPLSDDPVKALEVGVHRQAMFQKRPLDDTTPVDRSWLYDAGMPGRRLARKIRDARMLRKAQQAGDPQQEAQIRRYLELRGLAQNVQQGSKASSSNSARTRRAGSDEQQATAVATR